jgi:ISXO2-like transposase domain
MSDELRTYQGLGKEFWMHQTVNHSQEEYVRGIVHTNTVEGYYSIFKRGMTGAAYCVVPGAPISSGLSDFEA